MLQLYNLALGQISLIRNYEVVVRGGVTVGDAATSYRLVFGPGIVDAYELESTVALYPRIVVSKKVLDELRFGLEEDEVQKAVGPLLVTDEQGVLIDYLGITLKSDGGFFAVHRAFVEKQLRTANPTYRSKYEWLLAYHERTAAKRDKTGKVVYR